MATSARSVVAAGVRLKRDDGFVLLVRGRFALTEGVWSLPMAAVPDSEVAEETATRLLRDVLHLTPGRIEFAQTLSIDLGGQLVVANVFDANGWSGEPRYAERDLEDAGWVNPDAFEGVDIVPEVAAWLSGEAAPGPPDADSGTLAALLVDSRRDLLAAYEAIESGKRERALDGEWAPVDVLAHVASAEAYYMQEARRLIDVPGHAWRPFNTDQWNADRAIRPRPAPDEVVARLDAAQSETLRQLDKLGPSQLTYYGNHAERGVIRVGEAISRIADHDREHTAQLQQMQRAAR
jgi:hypothetical protein